MLGFVSMTLVCLPSHQPQFSQGQKLCIYCSIKDTKNKSERNLERRFGIKIKKNLQSKRKKKKQKKQFKKKKGSSEKKKKKKKEKKKNGKKKKKKKIRTRKMMT